MKNNRFVHNIYLPSDYRDPQVENHCFKPGAPGLTQATNLYWIASSPS